MMNSFSMHLKNEMEKKKKETNLVFQTTITFPFEDGSVFYNKI